MALPLEEDQATAQVTRTDKKLSYRRETRATLCISLNISLLLHE